MPVPFIVVAAGKFILALLGFVLSNIINVLKFILYWGAALLLTFWFFKNFISFASKLVNILDVLTRLLADSLTCDPTMSGAIISS